MAKRDTELILQYLRNITSKVSTLFERITSLEHKVIALGTACGTAFNQCKVVVNKLAEVSEEAREDLAEFGGVITSDTWLSANGC